MQNLDFYSTAATLLPLFFLTFIFERRTKNQEDRRAAAFLRLALFVAAAVAGEIAALHTLDVGHPSEGDRTIVIEALAITGFVVVYEALHSYVVALGSAAAMRSLRVAVIGFIVAMLYLAFRGLF